VKQLELTPELQDLIRQRIGADTDVSNIAVFEAIALNSLPLVGKKGTLWEGAMATPLTLRQIADHINNGGHIPLIASHDMEPMPKGRVFAAGLDYSEQGDFEVRTLFYLDATEQVLIDKINAASVDEVSISFLPTQYLCSECDFDYLGEGSNCDNIFTRTCGNGHEVGTDGTYLRMVGLDTLVELSLVVRGAADGPKILGRSSSKLAPASAQRLAAQGFELNGLVCQAQASKGEDMTIDTNKLTTDLIDAKTQVGVLTAVASGHEAILTASTEANAALNVQLTAVTAERDTAVAELETAKAASRGDEADAAIVYLTNVLTKLHVAADKSVEGLPTTIAALTAAIDEETKGLTAIIPAGGSAAAPALNAKDDAKGTSLSAFRTNRR